MNNNIKSFLLNYLYKLSRNLVNHSKKTEAGFNLIEVATVVIIIGILSAIIAPAWDAFVNRQRLRAAQNTVFQAMQSAQAAARGTRSSWQVSFKTENDKVWVGLHPASIVPTSLNNVGEQSGITENAWYPLAEKIKISDTSQKIVEVSLADNEPGDVLDSVKENQCTDTEPCRILFNYSGCPVYDDGNECTQSDELNFDAEDPITLTLTHENMGDARRCVKVLTLIGSMTTAENNDCD